MKTHVWAIILTVLTTLLTSSAQILYKFGVPNLSFNIWSIITNVPLISGLLLYIIGAAVLIIALKGGEVSVLYPIIATSYIWVSLLSSYFFDDALNVYKWIGILVIFAGVTLISVGSNMHNKKREVVV